MIDGTKCLFVNLTGRKPFRRCKYCTRQIRECFGFQYFVIVFAIIVLLALTLTISDLPALVLDNVILITGLVGLLSYLASKETNEVVVSNALLEQLNKDLDEKIKQKTKELLESNIELTKTKRMKSEFVGMINHELKSPITAVLSGVEVIKARGTKKFDESQHKLLDIIERSGQEMLRLTNDFLDISKVESGKIEIYPEHVPFADLLEEVIQSLKPEAKRKKIKIDAKFDKSISTVYADPVRLKQVMFNLVDNAIKYTGESGTVSITAVAFDNQVKIEVKDTGIGIKRESLSQIFDRFTKHVAGYKGTGLGLYIAKSFTEAHGGRIEVESTLGQGSTFRIFLPKGPAA